MKSAIETETVKCCVCGSGDTRSVGKGRDFEYNSCANDWVYTSCEQCGHHYLRERPTLDMLSTIYPSNYGNYSNSAKPGLAFRLKALMERQSYAKLLPASIKSVYDIGCGDGRLLDVIKTALPGVSRLSGCEISEIAAAGAFKRGYKVDIGDYDSVDAPKNVWDAIFMIQVIEHVPDPRSALVKAREMLTQDGLLVVETPSTECWDFKLFHKRYWGGFHFPRHFNLFKRGNLERLMQECGLEPISYSVKLQPVHWVWTVHHWLVEMGAPERFYATFNIRNPFWLGLATLVDALQAFGMKRSSNMQVVARKQGSTV